jgi:hypothetical protein
MATSKEEEPQSIEVPTTYIHSTIYRSQSINRLWTDINEFRYAKAKIHCYYPSLLRNAVYEFLGTESLQAPTWTAGHTLMAIWTFRETAYMRYLMWIPFDLHPVLTEFCRLKNIKRPSPHMDTAEKIYYNACWSTLSINLAKIAEDMEQHLAGCEMSIFRAYDNPFH